MEEKANLMLQSQKVGVQIEQLQTKIAEIEKHLQEIPTLCRKEQAQITSNAMTAFNTKKKQKLADIEKAVANKKASVSKMIDACTESEMSGPVGTHDISELESHLKKVYPEELIEDYKCLNPINICSDDEAIACYSAAEDAILNLQRGSLAAMIFNGLSALLDKAADYPNLGLKISGGMIVFLVGGLIVSPFIFLTTFAVLGVVCGIQGYVVQGLLRKIYSVKLYMNNSYDEEQFCKDKDDIMEYVCDYLEDRGKEAIAEVESETYTVDPDAGPAIQKKYDAEAKRLQDSLVQAKQDFGAAQKQLEELVARLQELAENEKKIADIARDKYLHTITWEKEWLKSIFLDVSEGNKVKVCMFGMCNSLYYTSNADMIKQFSRLCIWQSVLHMHPDFCSTIVLDYKYNGGDLVQFSGIPDRCCKLCYTDQEIKDQLNSINNRIRARTNNILSTCASISEYNELMGTYGAMGEYYVVVHIFGAPTIPETLLSNIRNGGRVGYFFKFYWTLEELAELKDGIPLDFIEEIFEITNNPLARTVGALKRSLESHT